MWQVAGIVFWLYRVYLNIGCRDGTSKELLLKEVEKSGLPSGSVEWINLDMSSMDSVRNFAQAILIKNVPISVLINNGMVSTIQFSQLN
jgi:short-subunit dehydrogenase